MQTKLSIRIFWQLVFLLLVFIIIFPIIFALGNSLKTDVEAYQTMTELLPETFHFENYVQLFTKLPLLKIIGNTFFISSVVTIIRMVMSFLAAYALTFYNFKGKHLYHSIVNLTLFIPFTAMMIPNYLTLVKLDLIDSVWGVMLPLFFSATGIFMLYQSMRSIPKSLIEVAKLDHVPDRRIMKEIVLPLVQPQLVATSIWLFADTWKEYAWPKMVLKNQDNYTLSIALQMFAAGEGGKGFTSIMAMSVLTMVIPLILYLIFQKYIIATFTSSGIK